MGRAMSVERAEARARRRLFLSLLHNDYGITAGLDIWLSAERIDSTGADREAATKVYDEFMRLTLQDH